MKEKVKVLKALADETRLRIAGLLMNRESLCVCEIIAAIRMKQSAVSKALRVLKEAGVINDERRAQWVYYSLNRNGENAGFKALKAILAAGTNDVAAGDDMRNLRKFKKTKCKGE